jgi:hypothetical protein
VVAFAYLVDRLRRVPGARWVESHVAWVIGVLLVVALVALVFWGSQRSPVRISIAGLAAGQLSDMQSWIIVSGDLERDPLFPARLRYVLTDADVPNAKMVVTSDVELATGQTTISGILVGGRLPSPTGQRWVGQMEADAELAREPDPPWITLGLTAAAVLLGLAGRTSYPLFLRRGRPRATTGGARFPVGVRSGSRAVESDLEVAMFVTRADAPVELHVPGSEPRPLLFHSALTSIEVGDLHRLSSSQPALVVHTTTDELTIGFATTSDRDAAHAALVAGAQ